MKPLIFTCLLTSLCALTPVAFAADAYVPIVGFPGITNAADLTTQEYVNAIYTLAITVGAILAVLQIIYAGVQYMLDGVVTHKSEAKQKIRGALLGLLIILSAVLILNTINPTLSTINFLTNAPSVNTNKGVITDTRTACQLSPRSQSCCVMQGGTYIREATGPRCSTNTVVTLPEIVPEITGDPLEDRRIYCENEPGREQTADGKCRETAGKEIVIPEAFNDDEYNRRDWCTGVRGRFDITTQKCHSQ